MVFANITLTYEKPRPCSHKHPSPSLGRYGAGLSQFNEDGDATLSEEFKEMATTCECMCNRERFTNSVPTNPRQWVIYPFSDSAYVQDFAHIPFSPVAPQVVDLSDDVPMNENLSHSNGVHRSTPLASSVQWDYLRFLRDECFCFEPESPSVSPQPLADSVVVDWAAWTMDENQTTRFWFLVRAAAAIYAVGHAPLNPAKLKQVDLVRDLPSYRLMATFEFRPLPQTAHTVVPEGGLVISGSAIHCITDEMAIVLLDDRVCRVLHSADYDIYDAHPPTKPTAPDPSLEPEPPNPGLLESILPRSALRSAPEQLPLVAYYRSLVEILAGEPLRRLAPPKKGNPLGLKFAGCLTGLTYIICPVNGAHDEDAHLFRTRVSTTSLVAPKPVIFADRGVVCLKDSAIHVQAQQTVRRSGCVEGNWIFPLKSNDDQCLCASYLNDKTPIVLGPADAPEPLGCPCQGCRRLRLPLTTLRLWLCVTANSYVSIQWLRGSTCVQTLKQLITRAPLQNSLERSETAKLKRELSLLNGDDSVFSRLMLEAAAPAPQSGGGTASTSGPSQGWRSEMWVVGPTLRAGDVRNSRISYWHSVRTHLNNYDTAEPFRWSSVNGWGGSKGSVGIIEHGGPSYHTRVVFEDVITEANSPRPLGRMEGVNRGWEVRLRLMDETFRFYIFASHDVNKTALGHTRIYFDPASSGKPLSSVSHHHTRWPTSAADEVSKQLAALEATDLWETVDCAPSAPKRQPTDTSPGEWEDEEGEGLAEMMASCMVDFASIENENYTLLVEQINDWAFVHINPSCISVVGAGSPITLRLVASHDFATAEDVDLEADLVPDTVVAVGVSACGTIEMPKGFFGVDSSRAGIACSVKVYEIKFEKTPNRVFAVSTDDCEIVELCGTISNVVKCDCVGEMAEATPLSSVAQKSTCVIPPFQWYQESSIGTHIIRSAVLDEEPMREHPVFVNSTIYEDLMIVCNKIYCFGGGLWHLRLTLSADGRYWIPFRKRAVPPRGSADTLVEAETGGASRSPVPDRGAVSAGAGEMGEDNKARRGSDECPLGDMDEARYAHARLTEEAIDFSNIDIDESARPSAVGDQVQLDYITPSVSPAASEPLHQAAKDEFFGYEIRPVSFFANAHSQQFIITPLQTINVSKPPTRSPPETPTPAWIVCKCGSEVAAFNIHIPGQCDLVDSGRWLVSPDGSIAGARLLGAPLSGFVFRPAEREQTHVSECPVFPAATLVAHTPLPPLYQAVWECVGTRNLSVASHPVPFVIAADDPRTEETAVPWKLSREQWQIAFENSGEELPSQNRVRTLYRGRTPIHTFPLYERVLALHNVAQVNFVAATTESRGLLPVTSTVYSVDNSALLRDELTVQGGYAGMGDFRAYDWPFLWFAAGNRFFVREIHRWCAPTCACHNESDPAVGGGLLRGGTFHTCQSPVTCVDVLANRYFLVGTKAHGVQLLALHLSDGSTGPAKGSSLYSPVALVSMGHSSYRLTPLSELSRPHDFLPSSKQIRANGAHSLLRFRPPVRTCAFLAHGIEVCLLVSTVDGRIVCYRIADPKKEACWNDLKFMGDKCSSPGGAGIQHQTSAYNSGLPLLECYSLMSGRVALISRTGELATIVPTCCPAE